MPPRVDVDGLHLILWQMRQSNGAVRLNQQDFADTIYVTKHTLSRLVARMADEGRLELVSGSRANTKTYIVADPSQWQRP